MTTKIEGIGKRASFQIDTVFNNIFHAIDLNSLRESYQVQDGKKALGIDEVTKKSYGKNLENNLVDLLARIKRYAYNPKASRLVEIPKEDGSTRPLAITCFEDKIVQTVVSQILTKIYDPIFLPCSFGYRGGMNQHDALRALMKYSNNYPMGTTVEIDLSQYFNSIPHDILFGILKEKIVDRKFLKLLEKLIRAPIMVNGKAELNRVGISQGSCLSPILANIYLHHVIDTWFEETKINHFEGKADMVRFADDMVFVFQHENDAKRFYEVLPKRLQEFGLRMHDEKSSIIKSGAKQAEDAKRNGKRLQTYKFLGFTCYWGQSRSGQWRLKYKSRADRVSKKLKSMRQHLKENLHKKTHIVIAEVKQVVIGWGNYHAISDNQKQVSAFIHQSRRALFCYVNRKGGKRKTNWTSFSNLLKRLNFPTYFKTTSMFRTG